MLEGEERTWCTLVSKLRIIIREKHSSCEPEDQRDETEAQSDVVIHSRERRLITKHGGARLTQHHILLTILASERRLYMVEVKRKFVNCI